MQNRFINRLRRDLQTMKNSYVDTFPVEIPNDDMKMWFVGIDGPKGSVYEGEKFKFRFPAEYPIEAPEVVFVGTSPDHEHIYSNGFICLSVLYDGWSAAMSVSSICLSIQSMLSSSPKKTKHTSQLIIQFDENFLDFRNFSQNHTKYSINQPRPNQQTMLTYAKGPLIKGQKTSSGECANIRILTRVLANHVGLLMTINAKNHFEIKG